MLCSTVLPMSGEVYSFADEAGAFPAAGVCLLYHESGDTRQAVTVPTSLSLSSYRLVVSPLNCSSEMVLHGSAPMEAARQPPPPALSIPLLSIEKWRVVVDTSSALVESYARSRHALRVHMDLFSNTQKHASDAAGVNISVEAPKAGASVGAGTHVPLSTSRSFYVMTLQTKHVFAVKLLFPMNAHSQAILKAFKELMVHELIFQKGRLEALPAFPCHAEKETAEAAMVKTYAVSGCTPSELMSESASERETRESTLEYGWTLYDPHLEAERQLCTTSTRQRSGGKEVQDAVRVGASADGRGKDLRSLFHWVRLPKGSNGYTLSPTYPRAILEPVAASEALLCAALTARGRARLPAVTFVHLGTGAVLARASQPLGRSPSIAQDTQICRALLRCVVTSASPPATYVGGARLSEQVKKVGVLLNLWESEAAVAPPPPARPTSSLFDDDSPPPRIGAGTVSKASPTTPVTSGVAAVRGARASQLRVMDCRPKMAAVGNAQMGGGYETGSAYNFCETEFCAIENVFAVYASFQKLRALIEAFDGDQPDEGFYRRLQETQWLTHIQRVLLAATRIADVLDRPDGHSCLVHCTDGWDRTSQCCAAAQLLLDPFYRTAVGFCILMEKEFASFGHKFAERCAHQCRGHTSYSTWAGVSGSDTEKAHELQVSPIWVQFMDVVYQIVRQFPDDFEFTTVLLEYLSSIVYAAMHGTFLCNSEQERELEGVRLRTSSVWTDVIRRVQAEKKGTLPVCFLNTTYNGERAWACMRLRPGAPHTRAGAFAPQPTPPSLSFAHLTRHDGLDPLPLNCNAKKIVYWEALYGRLDSDVVLRTRRQWRASHTDARTSNTIGALQVVVLPSPKHTSPTLVSAMSERDDHARRREPWMVALDAYLQGFIDHACWRRMEEVTHLSALQATTPRAYVASAQVSTWGVFDPDVCFECYKLSSSWVGLKKRAMCDACGHTFCSQCFASHQCSYQVQSAENQI